MISIVIPARADAEALARTLEALEHLQGAARAERLVAAWDPTPATELAIRGRARLLQPGGSTRAALMNAGAAAAAGDVLLFLHADSVPPPDALSRIEQALADPTVVGGAFEHRFAERDWRLAVLSACDRLRYRLTGNHYGDQGLFVRASVFHGLGGYRDLAIMEDLDFVRRLKRCGRVVLVRAPLATSGRRFLARGPLRTAAWIAWLLARDSVGLDVQRYAEHWRGPASLPPGSPWPAAGAPEPGTGDEVAAAKRERSPAAGGADAV